MTSHNLPKELSMSTQFNLSRWHGGYVEPGYLVQPGFGMQYAPGIGLPEKKLVPEMRGMFGPLFGIQSAAENPQGFGVGPLYDDRRVPRGIIPLPGQNPDKCYNSKGCALLDTRYQQFGFPVFDSPASLFPVTANIPYSNE
jgi:hypothetical protein